MSPQVNNYFGKTEAAQNPFSTKVQVHQVYNCVPRHHSRLVAFASQQVSVLSRVSGSAFQSCAFYKRNMCKNEAQTSRESEVRYASQNTDGSEILEQGTVSATLMPNPANGETGTEQSMTTPLGNCSNTEEKSHPADDEERMVQTEEHLADHEAKNEPIALPAVQEKQNLKNPVNQVNGNVQHPVDDKTKQVKHPADQDTRNEKIKYPVENKTTEGERGRNP